MGLADRAGPEWDVFWKTCEDLDVPFYLHPIAPKGYIFDQCFKDRSWLIGPVMSFKHGVAVHLTCVSDCVGVADPDQEA